MSSTTTTTTAAGAAGETSTFEWISRGKNTKLQFQLTAGVVSATLQKKKPHPSEDFANVATLNEREMTIERYNTSQLLRGIQQVTLSMAQLDAAQKKAVLESLGSRNIEVMQPTTTSCVINILALP